VKAGIDRWLKIDWRRGVPGPARVEWIECK